MQKIESIKKIARDTKQRIQQIARNNGWNTQIVHIFCEKCDGDFIFKENFISRLPKPVGISHEWIKLNFKYQNPEFFSRLFDESENVLFEVPPRRTDTYYKRIT